MAIRRRKVDKVTRGFIFLGSKMTVDNDSSHEVKTCLLLGKKTMKNLDSLLKSRDITLPTKVHIVKTVFFSSHKKGWASNSWWFWIVVLEKALKSPLDYKKIKLVIPKGNQPLILIGRTYVEAETLILWPPNVKSQLTGKTLMLGKIEVKKEMGWQMSWLVSITNSEDLSPSKLWETVTDGDAWCASVHGVAKNWTWLIDWTTATNSFEEIYFAL